MENILYFDNASTTFPKFESVYEKTMKIYHEIGVNFSRNNSQKSKEGQELKRQLVQNLKEIFSTENEIILNSSATFSANEIITGLDYSQIRTVYISPFEHNATYRVIKRIVKKEGIDLKILKFNGFELDFTDMKLQFLGKKPDLIICNHSSNVFGNILPVKEIFEEGKKYGAITVLDASQTGGILNFDTISPLSDFIIFAGHKNLYGTSGIGGYVYNKKIFLEPLLYGGTGIKSEDEDMPLELPERFEAGSPNILGMIGLKLATDEILKIGIENMKKRKNDIFEKLYEILKKFDYDLEILSEKENNIGIISVIGVDSSPQELETIFENNGVITRRGLHCAPIAHKSMGTLEKGGTLRLSVGYFNDENQLKKLEEILEEVF